MRILGLKYPPIKPKALPEHLIYHQATNRHELTDEIIDRFVMFSTKKGEEKVKAYMECMKTTVERDGVKNVPSVYVKYLMSPDSGLGLGTDFLKKRLPSKIVVNTGAIKAVSYDLLGNMKSKGSSILEDIMIFDESEVNKSLITIDY